MWNILYDNCWLSLKKRQTNEISTENNVYHNIIWYFSIILFSSVMRVNCRSMVQNSLSILNASVSYSNGNNNTVNLCFSFKYRLSSRILQCFNFHRIKMSKKNYNQFLFDAFNFQSEHISHTIPYICTQAHTHIHTSIFFSSKRKKSVK